MDDLERTYTPAEAAELFDFAPSLLRRYAAIYEGAGGTIPHDRRGGRVYSRTMLQHFAAARERVKAGETVEDALRTFDLAPAEVAPDAQSIFDAKQVLSQLERLADANGQLVEGVKAIGTRLEAVDRLEAKLDAVLAEVAELRAEVATPKTLPPATSAASVDRAIELEMRENGAAPEQPVADAEGSTTAEIDGEREHGATDDGLLVRTARWLERRLRGGRPPRE